MGRSDRGSRRTSAELNPEVEDAEVRLGYEVCLLEDEMYLAVEEKVGPLDEAALVCGRRGNWIRSEVGLPEDEHALVVAEEVSPQGVAAEVTGAEALVGPEE
eukprot:11658412-Alexandrium_andersonii.AAC.1